MTDAGTLRGKTALVTGGASGIGRAIAHALSARGAEVTVADRDAVAAESAARDLKGRAWAVDLADVVALENLSIHADILVNNAGFQHVSPIEDFDPVIFRTMMAVMVEAPFLLTRAVLPGMYERGFGRVVNISSIHGFRASPFKSAYVTAKHALEGLSKVIALEGGPRGVTSVCVSPGYVRTALVDAQITAQATAHGISPERVVEEILLAKSSVKRLVEPEEVADLVVWLCGSGMATGTSVTLDGGWSA
jgi:3-hydroxybutyrate dehydrogenase